MSARSQALVPLTHRATGRMAGGGGDRKRRHQGNTLAEYPYAGAFSAV